MYNNLFLLMFIAIINIGCGRGPEGAPGSVGRNGAQGEAGVQGIQGLQGTPGVNGINGTNGVDATPVTVVQLCPGVTTYPSVFSEVAFCIQGKLYATYSAHDGFSTEIPPGAYSSNGINSSCTFTVQLNCVVSH